MRIGKLASTSGVSIRMLRYYEEQGLLHPTRSDAGYRQYQPADIALVAKIQLFKQAGFTIEEMRPLLECNLSNDHGSPLCSPLKQKVAQKIAQIDTNMLQLAQAKTALQQYL